jgi:hypothetical protein
MAERAPAELTAFDRFALRARMNWLLLRAEFYTSIAYCLPQRPRSALLCRAANLEDEFDRHCDGRHALGRCGDCACVLLVGDQGYAYLDNDPICCAGCAPTWLEMRAMIAEPDSWEDEDSRRHAMARMDAAIAAGAAWTDRNTHPL